MRQDEKPDRGHERSADPGLARNGKDTGPLPYDDMVPQARLAIVKSAHMKAMTYSPRSDRIYDLDITPQARDLFQEITDSEKRMDPSLPIHLMAITCNTSTDMGDVMREAYIYASRMVNQPLIGTWTNSKGKKYLDVVIPVQFQFSEAFKNDENALELGKKYEQSYIVRLEPDGIYYPLKVH